MKKLFSAILTICLLMSLCAATAVTASAEVEETKIYFLNTADPNPAECTGPGYYAKFDTFVFDENNNNGVSFHYQGSGDGTSRCLWAFPLTQVQKTPYLHYSIPEDNEACYKITICNCWDVWPEIEIDIEPGDYCINLIDELENYQSLYGYYYVVPYVSDEFDGASINNLYLSNYGEKGDPIIDPTDFVVDTTKSDTAAENTTAEDTTAEDTTAEQTTEQETTEDVITVETADTQDESSETTASEDEGENKSKLPIALIAGIAAAVIVIAAVVTIIIKKKK